MKQIGTLGPAIVFALVAFIGAFLAALHPAHNGAVMSQLPSQVLIVVAFAALCFGCGYLTAFIECPPAAFHRRGLSRNTTMIPRRGAAHSDECAGSLTA